MKAKTRTVRVATRLPASVDVIWEKLQKIDTLRYIAAPYAAFEPAGDTVSVWAEGSTMKFRLKIFGFIPFGVHTIHMKRVDRKALIICSNEGNKYVPVWNHRIELRKTGGDMISGYLDEVEVYAGWKTPAVALWCRSFYKHRQKKWLKLLR